MFGTFLQPYFRQSCLFIIRIVKKYYIEYDISILNRRGVGE